VEHAARLGYGALPRTPATMPSSFVRWWMVVRRSKPTNLRRT